jgi:hypothetical protein
MIDSKIHSIKPTDARKTRDCTDPWFFVFITANGKLRPCCNRPVLPSEKLDKANISDILDGPSIRELRRQLLTGELDKFCLNCQSRALTDIISLRTRVRGELTRAVTTTRKD